jgi:hypothetical protein
MAKTIIPKVGSNQGLSWLYDIISLYMSKAITIPNNFKDQVKEVEEILKSDTSGLVNSLLDYAIDSACVDFSIETSNKNLTNILDSWLQEINKSLRGKIPVGVKALAREYYRERWKGSSFLVLRSIWQDVDGFYMPVKMWFVDGKDVGILESEDETKRIGEEKYVLIISKDKHLNLPKSKDEKIFVQKPYEKWSSDYPRPFIIQRGVYYNAKMLELMVNRGVNTIDKALDYLLMMKKGNAELAKLNKPEFTYSEDDLKKVKDDFKNLLNERELNQGTPTYTTNFDTEIEHLMPDYEKALKSGLYSPVERRILAGLGFIEVVEGITSTRKDAVLNPKLFISEVEDGINGFKTLMQDVVMTIIEENKTRHKKYTNTQNVSVRSAPVKNFFSEETYSFMRSIYDRGLLSKRTAVELGIGIDFDSEVERRKRETEDKLDDTMYPPMIQNTGESETVPDKKDKKIMKDRQPGSPEAKDFKAN